jgi:hypothetical protein
VFFNRDELATRKPARPPFRRDRGGVRILAPQDGDAGGTWIGVNEFGLTVGLANGPRVETEVDASAFRSRGLLVLDLLESADLAEIEARLSGSDASMYRPFSLFAIDRSGAGRTWSSDGGRIAGRPAEIDGALLLSSSRDAEQARSIRTSTLARMSRAHGGLSADLLAAFHASHEPERGPLSPCMHREDARTVSLTRIRVGEGRADVEYQEGPPCEGAPPARRSLPLVEP